MEIVTKARRWGSSLAVIIPKQVVESQRIQEDEEITLEIKKRPLVGELFGKFARWRTPTQQLKDEMRKGWA